MPEDPTIQLDEVFGGSLQSGSHFEVTVGRDLRDDFYIDVKKTKSDSLLNLSREDVFLTVPMGTHWQRGLGWHSYFGVPFQFKGAWWMAIGLQEIVGHPTRGSYPKSRAFLFPFDAAPGSNKNSDLVQNLQRLAGALKETFEGSNPNKLRLQREYGIVLVNSDIPVEHVWVEIEIIKLAARQYSEGRPILFRTLLLSEDQRPGRESSIIDIPPPVKDILKNPRNYIIAENAITSKRPYPDRSQVRRHSINPQQSFTPPETSSFDQHEPNDAPNLSNSNPSNSLSEKRSRDQHPATSRNRSYTVDKGQCTLLKAFFTIAKSFRHRSRK